MIMVSVVKMMDFVCCVECDKMKCLVVVVNVMKMMVKWLW